LKKKERHNMRYAVVIEKAPSNYAAYVPDLPVCIATGASVQETESLIREVTQLPSLYKAALSLTPAAQ
jgi:hypothetical protein